MGSIRRGGLALALCFVCLAFGAASAPAAEFPYKLEPILSLTGDCSVPPAPDDVKDPDCKPEYPPPPDRPSARFNQPLGVAIDAHGYEYVASYGGTGGLNGRIDVFDDTGSFITELAVPHGPRSVAVDSKGNLYVLGQVSGGDAELSRYTPTVYKPDEGEIVYGNPRVVVDTYGDALLGGVTVDLSNDRVYAAWWSNYITEYESAADGNDLLNTITPPGLNSNNTVAVDGQARRLYASSCEQGIEECVVLVLNADPPHNVLKKITGPPAGKFLSTKGWLGIAADEETGDFFVADLEATKNIYEFNENFEYKSKAFMPGTQAESALQIAVSNSPLNPAARNLGYLFAPIVSASGSVFAFEPPELEPPVVNGVGVANIGETEAELHATIAPGVDENGKATTYRIEYVSAAQFAANGFTGAATAATGTIPSGGTSRLVSAFATGLAPGTSYRFRVVAQNGTGDDEEESAFATYSDAVGGGACPNQSLRAGASALLPDCRAYELVTPPDTNGGPTKGAGIEGDRFGMVQSSPLGDVVSFELLGGALPGTEASGGFHGDPYKATRGPAGWSTTLAGPTGAQASKPQPGSFSPDQGYNFWLAAGEGTALVNKKSSDYVRYPDGRSELVGRGSIGTDPQASGRLITEGGTHIIFQTGALSTTTAQRIEPNSPPAGIDAVYDRTRDPVTGAEKTHVVSLLPGNVIPNADAAYVTASADGEGIAFRIGNQLYLRVGNAVTYAIGAPGAEAAGVSQGGKRIFYVEGGDLRAFDTVAKAVVDFTPVTDAVPVNVSPDGARAYFVSETVIPGAGQNPNKVSPQPGGQNLYLSEEGTIRFVATVTERDVEGTIALGGTRLDGLGVWTEAVEKRQPGTDPSRLTPDGSTLLFQSRANLVGYASGAFPQIYRYDRVADRLHCLSCPPTQAPATGGASLLSMGGDEAPFSRYGFVPNLRADGKRAFFESTEALVSGDVDGLRDVYEWEEQGVGTCTRPGGCVYLISSGQSATNDFLFGHSQSGDDAFFTTNDILIGGDQTSLSVYDARVGGGFAVVNAEPCPQVELCRGPAGAGPALPSPTSEALGSLREVKPGPRRLCPKGKRALKRKGRVVKRKGKVVCVKQGKNRKGGKGKNRKRGAEKGARK
jgi:hypothetical protein